MRILLAGPYWSPRRLDAVDPRDPFTGYAADGPFALTGDAHPWALYLLAENVRAESVVLEHPTCAEFEAELRRGYDLVCLSANRATMAATADMLVRARTLAPAARVVVGGPGVPDILDPLPADPDMRA